MGGVAVGGGAWGWGGHGWCGRSGGGATYVAFVISDCFFEYLELWLEISWRRAYPCACQEFGYVGVTYIYRVALCPLC